MYGFYVERFVSTIVNFCDRDLNFNGIAVVFNKTLWFHCHTRIAPQQMPCLLITRPICVKIFDIFEALKSFVKFSSPLSYHIPNTLLYFFTSKQKAHTHHAFILFFLLLQKV